MLTNKVEVIVMAKEKECPRCGSTAVEPCHQEPKVNCVREEKK